MSYVPSRIRRSFEDRISRVYLRWSVANSLRGLDRKLSNLPRRSIRISQRLGSTSAFSRLYRVSTLARIRDGSRARNCRAASACSGLPPARETGGRGATDVSTTYNNSVDYTATLILYRTMPACLAATWPDRFALTSSTRRQSHARRSVYGSAKGSYTSRISRIDPLTRPENPRTTLRRGGVSAPAGNFRRTKRRNQLFPILYGFMPCSIFHECSTLFFVRFFFHFSFLFYFARSPFASTSVFARGAP